MTMARPHKIGLEYFPLDVHLDDKFELIEAKHGVVGFAIIIKILQKLYANSYFYEIDENKLLIFAKRINVEIQLVKNCINDAIEVGLFNKKIYKKYAVLTSKGIQQRFIAATQRRKRVDFIENYLLIDDVKKLYHNRINVYINRINVDNNPSYCIHDVDNNSINVNINKQSKVKKSKSKVNISSPIVPSLQEVIEYFLSKNYPEHLAKDFFEYYENANPRWTDRDGKPIKSWKQKAIAVWFKNYNKQKDQKNNYKKSLYEQNMETAARAFQMLENDPTFIDDGA